MEFRFRTGMSILAILLLEQRNTQFFKTKYLGIIHTVSWIGAGQASTVKIKTCWSFFRVHYDIKVVTHLLTFQLCLQQHIFWAFYSCLISKFYPENDLLQHNWNVVNILNLVKNVIVYYNKKYLVKGWYLIFSIPIPILIPPE